MLVVVLKTPINAPSTRWTPIPTSMNGIPNSSEVADLVEVLVDSGLRLGEALALDYESINFETNLMSIWFNKGDRPRSIPMTSRVRSILERRKSNGSKAIQPRTISGRECLAVGA